MKYKMSHIFKLAFLYQHPSNWYMIERQANRKDMASVNTRYGFVNFTDGTCD